LLFGSLSLLYGLLRQTFVPCCFPKNHVKTLSRSGSLKFIVGISGNTRIGDEADRKVSDMYLAYTVFVLLSTGTLNVSPDEVQFQAHRGGLKEVPENTLAAYRHAWGLGAIPEVDICSTADKVIICLHDDTLKRTTNATVNADTPVSKLNFDEIRQWDAGAWFDAKYTGEKVPSLEDVLREMAAREKACMYLDLKNVDLKQLASLLNQYGVASRVIFCHNKIESCRTMREAVPGLRTMLWIGGEANEIQEKFRKAAAEEFRGLDQVQLHLKAASEHHEGIRYQLDDAFLREALQITSGKKIDLEVLPFEFDCDSLSRLLDLGIRWYATDEPKRFNGCLRQRN